MFSTRFHFSCLWYFCCWVLIIYFFLNIFSCCFFTIFWEPNFRHLNILQRIFLWKIISPVFICERKSTLSKLNAVVNVHPNRTEYFQGVRSQISIQNNKRYSVIKFPISDQNIQHVRISLNYSLNCFNGKFAIFNIIFPVCGKSNAFNKPFTIFN